MITEDVEKIFFIGDRKHRDDPKNYNGMMSDIDSEKWLNAMKSKIDSMHSNQVQTLVDPLEGIVSISCKQIYKKKIDLDEKVEIYKERFVVKDYSQHEGIDYQEIF